MEKVIVLEHFGDVYAVAAALGITRQAVEQWAEVIPEGSAYKLQAISGGALRVDPEVYRRLKRRRARAAA